VRAATLATMMAVLLGLGCVPAFAAAPPGALDDGLLDAAWFGAPGPIEFHDTGLADYLWVKPGLSLAGRRLKVTPWEKATFFDTTRDERDRAAAAELTAWVPGEMGLRLAEGLKADPACCPEDGDLLVTGRFVDVNAGRAAAFVWPAAAFEIKVVAAASGELLAAIHTRLLGKTKLAMKSWFKKLSRSLADGLEKEYLEGKPATK
jgi:hypothetical protein